MPKSKIVKKLVSAYPFDVAMKGESNGLAFTARALKLTPTAMMVELPAAGATSRMGDRFACEFELPVFHTKIAAPMTLVKLHNQLAAGGGIARLAELQFKPALEPRDSVHVIEFVRASTGKS